MTPPPPSRPFSGTTKENTEGRVDRVDHLFSAADLCLLQHLDQTLPCPAGATTCWQQLQLAPLETLNQHTSLVKHPLKCRVNPSTLHFKERCAGKAAWPPRAPQITNMTSLEYLHELLC